MALFLVVGLLARRECGIATRRGIVSKSEVPSFTSMAGALPLGTRAALELPISVFEIRLSERDGLERIQGSS
jgi:hypothetical protein